MDDAEATALIQRPSFQATAARGSQVWTAGMSPEPRSGL